MTGTVAGALLTGRMVRRVKPLHRIRDGFLVKGRVLIANLLLNVLCVPEAWQAILLVAPCSLGWAMLTPVVPLRVLFPERRSIAFAWLWVCLRPRPAF